MFKENYIKKLAFDNIRRQKHLYRYMLISLALSFFLTSFMFIMISSNEKITYTKRASTFGKWSVAIEDSMREQVNVDYRFEQGRVYFLSDVYAYERQIGKLGSMDEKGYELANLQLIEGRYPTSNQEIVIEESQCQYLGISHKLDQMIHIELDENGQNISKKMKLVGIFKEYSHVYPIEMPTFITQEESDHYTLLLNSDKPLNVFNYFVTNNQEQYVVNNFYTYNHYGWDIDKYIDHSIVEFMEGLIVFIGLLGILATTISSMHKRTEYLILMRSLGMTQQQIQEMVLYEGFFLMIVGGFIGTISGIVMSVLSILFSHLIWHVPFLIEINIYLLLSLLGTILLGYLSMVIGTISLSKVSLNSHVRQKIVKPRHRKVRKLNILSLAVQEITSHRKSFYLLSLLIGVIIMSCSALFTQWNNFTKTHENDIGFSHTIFGESLTIDDFDKLAAIDGLNPLFIQSQSVRIHTDGLENWDNSERFQTNPIQFHYEYWMPDETIMTYKGNLMSEILSKQNIEGRLPQSEDETLAIIPYMDVETERTSFQPIDSQSLEKQKIQIGDKLDVADISNDVMYSQQLKVVGTVTYKVPDKKIAELTSHGEYQFVVIPTTFSKLFQNTGNQSIYIDTEDKQFIHQMKSEVYTILKSKPDAFFDDNISISLISRSQIEQDFIKNICFMSLMIIGVSTMLYMQRKIRVMAMKHEIGLFKALGLTHNQLIGIYMIYDGFVYLMGICFVVVFISIMNFNNINSLWDILNVHLFNYSFLVSGILVMVIMILPFLIQKSMSVIELLNYTE